MDSAAEGAGSCDEPAPKVKRSSMFRRYQAEVMAARANAQVRRSSDLVRKHRMAEAAQLAAEAAAEVAAVEAAHAAEQAAEQAAAQAAYRANVRDSPPGMTQSPLEQARREAMAAEEMTVEAAPSVRAAAVPASLSARIALAEQPIEQPKRPGAAPPAPPPTSPPAAASEQVAPHPPEPLAQAQPTLEVDDHRDYYRDQPAATQPASSGSVLARGSANEREAQSAAEKQAASFIARTSYFARATWISHAFFPPRAASFVTRLLLGRWRRAHKASCLPLPLSLWVGLHSHAALALPYLRPLPHVIPHVPDMSLDCAHKRTTRVTLAYNPTLACPPHSSQRKQENHCGPRDRRWRRRWRQRQR